MENIPNFGELETIEKTIFLLICTTISFAAYLVAIKGMYDFFPNVFRALGAFLIELVVSTALGIAMFGIFRATATDLPTDLNPVILLTLIVSMIITVFVRKVTLNYATEVPTSLLQAINSLVMHFFYILIITSLIALVYIQVFDGRINLRIFEK